MLLLWIHAPSLFRNATLPSHWMPGLLVIQPMSQSFSLSGRILTRPTPSPLFSFLWYVLVLFLWFIEYLVLFPPHSTCVMVSISISAIWPLGRRWANLYYPFPSGRRVCRANLVAENLAVLENCMPSPASPAHCLAFFLALLPVSLLPHAFRPPSTLLSFSLLCVINPSSAPHVLLPLWLLMPRQPSAHLAFCPLSLLHPSPDLQRSSSSVTGLSPELQLPHISHLELIVCCTVRAWVCKWVDLDEPSYKHSSWGFFSFHVDSTRH